MSAKNTLRKCRTGAILSLAGIAFSATSLASADEVSTQPQAQPVVTTADPATTVLTSAVSAGFSSQAQVGSALSTNASELSAVEAQLSQPDYQPERVVSSADPSLVAERVELEQEQVTVTAELASATQAVSEVEQTLASATQAQTQAQSSVSRAQSAVSDAEQDLVTASAPVASTAVSAESVDQAVKGVELATTNLSHARSVLAAETNNLLTERVSSVEPVSYATDYTKGDGTHAPVSHTPVNLAPVTSAPFLKTNAQGNLTVNWGSVGPMSDADRFRMGIYSAMEDAAAVNGLSRDWSSQLQDHIQGRIPAEHYATMERRVSASLMDYTSHARSFEDGLSSEVVATLRRNHANGQQKDFGFLAYEALSSWMSEIGNPLTPWGHARTVLMADPSKVYAVPVVSADPDDSRVVRVSIGFFAKPGVNGREAGHMFVDPAFQVITPSGEKLTTTQALNDWTASNGRLRVEVNGRPLTMSPKVYENVQTSRPLSEVEREARLTPFTIAVSEAQKAYDNAVEVYNARRAAYEAGQTASTTAEASRESATLSARQNLTRLQAELTKAQEALNTASTAVRTAERDLASARQTVQTLTARLAGIEARLAELASASSGTVTLPEVAGLTPAQRSRLEQERGALLAEKARLERILADFGRTSVVSTPVANKPAETKPATTLVASQPSTTATPSVSTSQTNPAVSTPVANKPSSTATPAETKPSASPVVSDAKPAVTPVDKPTSETNSADKAEDATVTPAVSGAKPSDKPADQPILIPADAPRPERVGVAVTRPVDQPLAVKSYDTVQFASTPTATKQATAQASVVSGTQPQSQAPATLPSTGEASAVLSTVLGGIASTLGLVGLRRRRF